MMRPDRHSFVRADGPLEGEAGAWAAAGRWFVVASSRAGDDPGTVRLGLATPDKRRIGFCLPLGWITDMRPPPTLEEVRDAAPQWRGRLDDLAQVNGVSLRVYGSLAWQALTGLPYLRAGSDLDLLVTDLGDARAAIAAMLAGPNSPRLDGEVLLSDGNAVALREYVSGREEMLVKGHGGPWLRKTAA